MFFLCMCCFCLCKSFCVIVFYVLYMHNIINKKRKKNKHLLLKALLNQANIKSLAKLRVKLQESKGFEVNIVDIVLWSKNCSNQALNQRTDKRVTSLRWSQQSQVLQLNLFS